MPEPILADIRSLSRSRPLLAGHDSLTGEDNAADTFDLSYMRVRPEEGDALASQDAAPVPILLPASLVHPFGNAKDCLQNPAGSESSAEPALERPPGGSAPNPQAGVALPSQSGNTVASPDGHGTIAADVGGEPANATAAREGRQWAPEAELPGNDAVGEPVAQRARVTAASRSRDLGQTPLPEANAPVAMRGNTDPPQPEEMWSAGGAWPAMGARKGQAGIDSERRDGDRSAPPGHPSIRSASHGAMDPAAAVTDERATSGRKATDGSTNPPDRGRRTDAVDSTDAGRPGPAADAGPASESPMDAVLAAMALRRAGSEPLKPRGIGPVSAGAGRLAETVVEAGGTVALPQPLATGSPQLAAAAPAPAPSAPPAVHVQIAHAIDAGGESRVALVLAPEDLGQVRLELHHRAEGLAVQIAADRPETLDLIRRHLDDLGRELRALGHQGVAFSFSDNAAGQRRSTPWTGGAVAGAEEPAPGDGSRPPARTGAASGLDIRL